MLTTDRLNQNLKNRMSALPFLSSQAKSLSRSLRGLLSLSLQASDQSLSLVNEGTKIDIRCIAQKHDQGGQLSDREISFLLAYAESALYGSSFAHQETLQTLSEAFTSFVRSRCYAANHHTIHIFKKFNLIGVALGDKEGGEAIVSLFSRGFYSCMEEVAEAFQVKLQAHPCPLEDHTLIEPLKAFTSCLSYFLEGNQEHILSPLSFRKALHPYLTSFIQIAKCAFYRKEWWNGIPPFHIPNQNTFVHEQGLDKPLHFHSKNIHCHVFANDLENIRATFVFEKKGATLSLGFTAFDDLLEMGHYISRFASFKEQTEERGSIELETKDLSFLWSSVVENKISSLLRAQDSSFMLDAEETQEFIEFLLEIAKKFSAPLKALRYQLGSL